jgi:hypothetical protein
MLVAWWECGGEGGKDRWSRFYLLSSLHMTQMCALKIVLEDCLCCYLSGRAEDPPCFVIRTVVVTWYICIQFPAEL